MKRLLYSHGEPAGIGIDLILHLSKSKFWEQMQFPLVCIVDKALLKSRSKILNLKINFVEIESLDKAKRNKLAAVQFIQISKCKDLSPGSLNPKNAKYVDYIVPLSFSLFLSRTLSSTFVEYHSVSSNKK